MPCYDNNQMVRPTPAMHLQDYSYVSCSLIMYQDGGGGGGAGAAGSGGGGVDDGGGADEVSTRSGSNDFGDDNSSWSEEYALNSYAGTSVSSDSGDGWSGDDDGRTSSSGSGDGDGGGGGGPAGNKATRDGGGDGGGGNDGTGNKSKWLRSLWTIIDRMDDRDRKSRDGKRSPRPVKTILRPPTTYKYVVGMSGFPSKVAVYPKRM